MCRFTFSSPFARDGQGVVRSGHGPMEEQWQERTILTTERCFPYLKTRIKIIKTETSELSPIQVIRAVFLGQKFCLHLLDFRNLPNFPTYIKVAIKDVDQKLGKLKSACRNMNLTLLEVKEQGSWIYHHHFSCF